MWTKEELEEGGGGLIGITPYIVVAWIYASFADYRDHAFWKAFGFLIGVKFAIWVLDATGTAFAFMVYNKRRKVNGLLEYLHKHGFPKHREANVRTFDGYLEAVKEEAKYPTSLRMAARDLEIMNGVLYEQAGLAAVRLDYVQRKVLEIYAPIADSKVVLEPERRRQLG